jgi:hypothetical protein
VCTFEHFLHHSQPIGFQIKFYKGINQYVRAEIGLGDPTGRVGVAQIQVWTPSNIQLSILAIVQKWPFHLPTRVKAAKHFLV